MKNSLNMIFVLCCLFAGCVTQSIAPAHLYTLSPEWGDRSARTERVSKSPLIIKLAPVRATQALTGAEIIYTDSHFGLNSYAHSRWSDAPVKLLQTLFQVALEENGRFRAVIPPTSAAGADLLLESTLFDFSHHIKDDGTSDGVIRSTVLSHRQYNKNGNSDERVFVPNAGVRAECPERRGRTQQGRDSCCP